MPDQTIKAGDGSSNFQAGGPLVVNVSQGLTFADVRTVALDVFRANMTQLAGLAREEAGRRAENFVDEFLRRNIDKEAQVLAQSGDPSFQDIFYKAQKAAVLMGDESVEKVLQDLLAERIGQACRNLERIMIDESISILPQLTNEQLAAVAAIFRLRYVSLNVTSISELVANLEKSLRPFAAHLPADSMSYRHLAYAGCGSISMGSISLADVFKQHIPALFSQGFTKEVLQQAVPEIDVFDEWIRPCMHDASKLQLNMLNKPTIAEQVAMRCLDRSLVNKLDGLNQKYFMAESTFSAVMISHMPFMERVMSIWKTTPMNSFELQSVGFSLGHANLRRVYPELSPLSVWIKSRFQEDED